MGVDNIFMQSKILKANRLAYIANIFMYFPFFVLHKCYHSPPSVLFFSTNYALEAVSCQPLKCFLISQELEALTDGHLGYFQSFAIRNKAAMNTLCGCHSLCVCVCVCLVIG